MDQDPWWRQHDFRNWSCNHHHPWTCGNPKEVSPARHHLLLWVRPHPLGIFTIIDLAMEAEDFTTTAGVAWTLIIMVSLAILGFVILLSLPVYSLYLKLRREVKEEQVYKISFTSILCSH